MAFKCNRVGNKQCKRRTTTELCKGAVWSRVKDDETKLLGLKWNKSQDMLKVSFPEVTTEKTKRGILRHLASIFDPLGFVSPITLLGKFVYRDTCRGGQVL